MPHKSPKFEANYIFQLTSNNLRAVSSCVWDTNKSLNHLLRSTEGSCVRVCVCACVRVCVRVQDETPVSVFTVGESFVRGKLKVQL